MKMELSVIKKDDPYHREKPIDKFIAEVESAVENYGIGFIYFTDESFLSMSPKRFEKFIEQYNTIKLPFFIESRVETIRPGFAEALDTVGCSGIAIGVESGSLDLRRRLLKRMMSDATIIQGFREFEKTNIRVSANNIIGFPEESRKDIMRTIEINRQVRPDSIIVNAFRPYSGTELRQICIEKNLISLEERAEDNRAYGAFYNGVLSADELEGIRRVFNLYVKFPKDRWHEVRIAETDYRRYETLKEEFKELFILNNSKALEAEELFITD